MNSRPVQPTALLATAVVLAAACGEHRELVVGGLPEAAVSSYVVAVSSVRLDTLPGQDQPHEDAWATIGLDLDARCTGATDCDGCEVGPSCTAAGPHPPSDGEQCRDNTFGRLLAVAAQVPELAYRLGLSQAAINCSLWRGELTLLIRLNGYNGTTDDDDVTLDLYSSPGLQTKPDWTCVQDERFADNEQWSPSSPWLVDEADLAQSWATETALPASRHRAGGRVIDGRLEAQLPAGWRLRLPGDNSRFNGLSLALHGGHLQGELVLRPDMQLEIRDGVLAGAVPRDDLLRAFRELGLCPDGEFAAIYLAVDTFIAEMLDLNLDGDSDSLCDAMSAGIGFEALPATPAAATEIAARSECDPPQL